MGRSARLAPALGSVALIPLRTPQEAQRPTAIALGSFDGLHRGHRRVIAAVTGPAAASEPQLIPTVVSFWPHPREVLHGEPRLRLDLPSEKLELLEPLGIRQLVLVPFDRQLAALDPEAFVDRVLVNQLDSRRIAVGTNFRFGVNRQGDTDTLAALAAARGIQVEVVPMLTDGEERLSSSRIRRALAAGDLVEAERLLQRPYRFRGVVVRGRGLGRQLGWPTANLQVDGRKFLPMEGVYAAWAQLDAAGPWLPAVMNLGPQPTVDPLAASAVEVHLLDRQVELTGRQLQVEPVALLRRQQRFDGVEALSAQIGRDAARARSLTAGVGVGEPPGHEGGDAAQQQNP
ncbi:Riboflavin biosynthesis protein RibF [Includes: Riboflavin kinase; FMN adenylyltransferase] [Cyanobium sp. NIES-981]|nr:Riboflavin biosynthesis protein RibF [Includes: Riboflavin kinase; FMN adenylyltransferase] [Cyanobium sp. NIES-981]